MMNGRLAMSFTISWHVEEFVEPDVSDQVQEAVEEREQPQHAAETDQLRQAQQFARGVTASVNEKA